MAPSRGIPPGNSFDRMRVALVPSESFDAAVQALASDGLPSRGHPQSLLTPPPERHSQVGPPRRPKGGTLINADLGPGSVEIRGD